jgi:serine/threonine protein kinase
MSLEIGQVIDNKYRIVKLIGEGGMGAVYEGENARIRRRVAIKVLHPSYCDNAEVMQRFEREAQAAGTIGNDHILEVLDLGALPDGARYMVMEFLEGEPLGKRIENAGRLQPAALAPLIRQVLAGLGAAHSAGIIHRDLKPDNIFILREKAGTKDYVKIIDFGISKFSALTGDSMKMTRTGTVMGTPFYMSPEQATGSREADARSDIYAIGVIMYEAITGRVPFEATTFNQLLFKIALSEPTPVQALVPDIDPAFATLINRAMARDADHRFQSAHEFSEAIRIWIEQGRGVMLPPTGPANMAHGRTSQMASSPGFAGTSPGAPALTQSQADAAPTKATAGSWASSQPGVNPFKPKPTPIAAIAVAAGVGLLVVAGGIAAVLAMTRGGNEEAAAPASASEIAVAPPEPPKPPEVAPAAAPEKLVEPAKIDDKSEEEKKKEAAKAESATEPKAASTAQPKPAARATSRPAARPAARDTKKSSSSAAPDFGY